MRFLPVLLFLLLAACSAATRPPPVVQTIPDEITPLTVEQERDLRR